MKALTLFGGLCVLTFSATEAFAFQLEARDGIYTTDNRNYIIRTPADRTYDAGGFLLSPGSDVNGICRGFGFTRSLPNSTRISERAEGRRTVINSYGSANGIVVTPFFIESLGCTNEYGPTRQTYISAREGSYRVSSSVVRYFMPVDGSVDPSTTIQISPLSNADGICQGLARGRAVPGSMMFAAGPSEGRRSIIDWNGTRTALTVDHYYVSSVDCVQR